MSPRQHIIAYSLLLVVVLILSYIIIFRKPDPIDMSNKERVLKDSIEYLQGEVKSSILRQDSIQKAYDSLSSLEPPIIYKTREKIHFIISTASIHELDSTIRTNWKTKSRYN